MRPSSLGGGRILRRTLSVCLSVRPVSGCTLFTVAPSYERTSKIDVCISYGHLGRTNSCLHLSLCPKLCVCVKLYYTIPYIQNRKTSVFAYGPASRMYFSARAEGRISYGHLGRTNSCLHLSLCPKLCVCVNIRDQGI